MFKTPGFNPTLATELRSFGEMMCGYKTPYGEGARFEDVLIVYLMSRGISSITDVVRHALPIEVDEKVERLNIFSTYDSQIFAPNNLKMIVVGQNILVANETTLICFGSVQWGTPGYIAVHWTGLPDLVEFIKTKKSIFNTQAQPTVNRYSCDERQVWTDGVILPSFTSLPDELLAYPSIGITPADLWEAFAESSNNVLILIGMPGTGKSSYIRSMLNRRGWDDFIYVADSHRVLLHPQFMEHVRSIPRKSVVITEDSDSLLMKRTEGNDDMAALLNAASGLVATDTKYIISTNLESLNKVDSAILRRGRLFKKLEFKLLSIPQAKTLRESLSKPAADFKSFGDKVSLSDALNVDETDNLTRSVGAMGYR